MRNLPRVMPALVTPFNRRGEIDRAAHRHNVALMWDRGIRGLLVAGSTGEGPYLEPGERRVLVEEARATCPGVFVLCGIHAETDRIAESAVSEAHTADADAVLVTTPTTFIRQRPDLIASFFTRIAASAPLPVLLYSVPKVTGVEIDEPTIASLGSLPGVVGMKDSGGDPLRAGRIVDSSPDAFALFIGSTPALAMSLTGGAYGAITASANYAPRLVTEVVKGGRRSYRAAAPFQSQLTAVSSAIERYGIPGVKYAAGRIGLAPGTSRLPLQPLEADATRLVRRALSAAELA